MVKDVSRETKLKKLKTEAYALAKLADLRQKRMESVVRVGFVASDKSLVSVHEYTRKGLSREKIDAKPDIFFPVKLKPALDTDKRFIVIYGGRGSGKSVGVADICLLKSLVNQKKTYCLREFQSSIKNSVHSLLSEEIERLSLPNFEIQERTIKQNDSNAFEFLGISRNYDSIKSAHGFSTFWVEEAQFISESSLTALTPTARSAPKSGLPGENVSRETTSMIFVANPGSSNDPFSSRFISPFKRHLDKDGIYEDDLHLIINMNYVDNPWYSESGLESERQWDLENRSRALYDHIWLGAYNDHVDDAIIMPEWFDACIDAHEKLGFRATGAIYAAHDPSDVGPDPAGFAVRHGSVVIDAQLKSTGDSNEKCDWALGLANTFNVDHYTWDCDGLGAALRRQTADAFKGKATKVEQFKGSESPDFAGAVYSPAEGIKGTAKWEDTVRNKRAQYYLMLRDRIYLTYRAVVHGEWTDPDSLISFSSKMQEIDELRSELCRLPKKINPNGKFELYTKADMRSKFGLTSPNLADCVMMLMRVSRKKSINVVIPRPIKPVNLNARNRRN